MRIDAAVRYDQYIRVGQSFDIMRTDATAGKFVNADIAKFYVPNTNPACAGAKIIFGCIEPATVLRKHTMSKKVPLIGCFKAGCHLTGKAVDDHGKIAGASGKGDGLRPGWMSRRRMAATRQG